MTHSLRTCLLAIGLFLGMVAPAAATHIVGGEFSMTRVQAGLFDLKLTLYFDAINGSVGAIDPGVQAFIAARNDTNFVPVPVIMDLIPDLTYVAYTNPDCEFVDGAVKTRILTYTARVTLSETLYSDPGGYYLVYERCCRNGIIGNISLPGATGQAFYLEFPALAHVTTFPDSTVLVQPFVNSSPTLFKPLSDFACVNQAFEFDFSGRDPDGDSLAYSVVPPFAGYTSAASPGQYPSNPAPFMPAPYPTVDWLPGYSNTVEITGNPPLSIGATSGILRMTANRQGLFVFAIECREYRQGIYLGTVRREFQVYVRDCALNTPPKITVHNEANILLHEGDTLTLYQGNGVCVPVQVADSIPDTEVLTLTSDDLPDGARITSGRGPSSEGRPFVSQLCIDDCLAYDTVRYGHLILRVRDNFCSIPARDSLHLVLKVVPTPVDPQVLPRVGFVSNPGSESVDTVLPRGPILIEALAMDTGANVQVTATITPELPDFTLNLTGANRSKNVAIGFTVPCDVDTNIVYVLKVLATSTRCGIVRRDSAIMRFRTTLQLTDVSLTLADSLGRNVEAGTVINLLPGQYLSLTGNVMADDNSPISVQSQSEYAPLPIVRATGTGLQKATLRWQATCADALRADTGGAFTVTFKGTSQDCRGSRIKTIEVQVLVHDTSGGDVKVGNVITLNGDKYNEYFRLAEPLPVANCAGTFEGVDVFNRWGRRVFHSDDIGFAWKPEDERSGLFFYRLGFQGKVFRGWVEAVGR